MTDVNGTLPSDQPQGLSRRQFIKLSGVSGLALGLAPALDSSAKSSDSTAGSAAGKPIGATNQPSEFLHIAPDGRITIQINRLEFGQGSHTGLELDADWRLVDAQLAKAGPAYIDPVVKIQYTGSSSGIRRGFAQYRELGARARAMCSGAAMESFRKPD